MVLLIHCHAGISRSSAIALAVIAKRLGSGMRKKQKLWNILILIADQINI